MHALFVEASYRAGEPTLNEWMKKKLEQAAKNSISKSTFNDGHQSHAK